MTCLKRSYPHLLSRVSKYSAHLNERSLVARADMNDIGPDLWGCYITHLENPDMLCCRIRTTSGVSFLFPYKLFHLPCDKAHIIFEPSAKEPLTK